MAATAGSGQEVLGHEKKLGTGVSVSSLGHILTTRNVVKGCSDFAVQTTGFTEAERTVHLASLIAESPVSDLALLKAELPKGRPFAPLLVWESKNVFIPTNDRKVVQSGYLADTDRLIPTNDELQSGYLADTDRLDEIISFGYVSDIPGLIESVNAPPDSHTLAATSGKGSGVFDMHGNLIGLVYSSTTEELERKLIGEQRWLTPDYSEPAFFHGLNAIASFLVENNISFRYQVVGKSKPMQGNGGIVGLYGFVGRVTYMVLCRSND